MKVLFSALCLCLLTRLVAAGDLPANFDYYYGVYLQDKKVGWMHTTLQQTDNIVVQTELHAVVRGMGQASEIALREKRVYGKDAKHVLKEIDFSQTSATGKVQVRGKIGKQNQLDLQIDAGGATTRSRIAVKETLNDALATYQLARSAKVGNALVAQHFDPSIQKTSQVEHKVLAIETHHFAGIAIQAIKIDSFDADLGVHEIYWMDNQGKVLESDIGGFFKARLEAEDVAKKLDYQQDMLLASVVVAPTELHDPYHTTALHLVMTGFGDFVPPNSSRQQTTQQDGKLVIDIKQDAPIDNIDLTKLIALHKNLQISDAKIIEEATRPTPFIQSEAQEIVQAAKRATQGSRNVAEINQKLIAFVYKHIRSEYIPAYSNALEAYKSARGDCTEHSILYVAMARALHIPARVAVGIAYWPPGKGFGWHAWAEIYVNNRWIAVDPTWNQAIADATHIKLADGGPAEQARIVMLLGQLKIVSMGT